MMTLLTIFALAVLVMAATKAGAARLMITALLGLLCLGLGSRGIIELTRAFAEVPLVQPLFAAESGEAAAEPEPPKPESPAPAAEAVSSSNDSQTGGEETQAKTADATSAGSEPAAVATAEPAKTQPSTGEPNGERGSVEFVTHIRYLTPNRPAWLDRKPDVDGDTQRVAVKAGPYYRIRQCVEDLNTELKSATDEVINEHLATSRAAALLGYNVKEIRNRFVRETFEEQLETSVGVMNQAHALLVFDASFFRELDERWRQIRALGRLVQVAVGSGIVLLLVTTLFGYFRLDTATKGYYTGRLQIATAAAILTLVAASVLVMKWIPWM